MEAPYKFVVLREIAGIQFSGRTGIVLKQAARIREPISG